MEIFERELRALWQEVGRRMVAWVVHHLEPTYPEEAPPRLWWQGRASRRRRKHRATIATLCGPVVVWRRLYEPLTPGRRAIHPLELHWGIAAGVATPALAERGGRWAADHAQRQVLDMVAHDHGVHGSCPTLRKLLSRLSAAMGSHRQVAQVDQVVRWLHHAQASTGRFQPTLAVGRDGVNVPRRHGEWKEGATATVSVMDRRGTRGGTVSLGQRPEAGQPTLTTQLTALIQDILKPVDAHSLRFVSVSDDGYHPSDSDHTVWKKMQDPKRPWCPLPWRRIVDSSHACLSIQQVAEALCGPSPQGRAWAKQMRKHLKTHSDGIPRVWQSAGALRHRHGLWGKAKDDDQAYAYLKKRTHWMRYRHYSSQHLPIGSGITEAACKIVCTQRLKRSGMSWTLSGGQVILDLRVIWLSGVWETVYQRYLASQPLPVAQVDMAKGAQHEQQAA
jgi:hypothetical protein